MASPALERLKTNPDDADANLQAGRFHCFFKDRWQDGLILLSKGSDSALKSDSPKKNWPLLHPRRPMDLADGWYDMAGSQPANSNAESWLMPVPGTKGRFQACPV